MLEDTPRRKLIKPNQQKENDVSPSLLNKDNQEVPIFDDDLAEKVEQCFRNEQQRNLLHVVVLVFVFHFQIIISQQQKKKMKKQNLV
jgi:hypothetical protein